MERGAVKESGEERRGRSRLPDSAESPLRVPFAPAIVIRRVRKKTSVFDFRRPKLSTNLSSSKDATAPQHVSLGNRPSYSLRSAGCCSGNSVEYLLDPFSAETYF